MKTRSLEIRFWEKADKADSCWEWLGGKINSGYGKFQQTTAHRVAYELTKGRIAKGLEVDHLCRNRLCVNPDHLEAVTKQINMIRRRNVTCHRGHPMSGNNLYIAPNGARGCRDCRILACKKHKEKVS